jgi:stress-induced morphogen
MTIAQDKLRSIIEESFPNADIEIIDLAGDDDHYSVKIIDGSFTGKGRIEQHRMVNKALGECLGGELHAMALKTSGK